MCDGWQCQVTKELFIFSASEFTSVEKIHHPLSEANDDRVILDHQSSSSSLDFLISPTFDANTSSSLSFLKGLLPKYFSSEWSFAQFHVPEGSQFLAAFGSQNSVLIISMDGSFYKCSFDPKNGGEMTQEEHIKFLKADNRRSHATS